LIEAEKELYLLPQRLLIVQTMDAQIFQMSLKPATLIWNIYLYDKYLKK
jgi:hypothetical protein